MNKLEELEKKYKELGEEIERLKGKSVERWRAEYEGEYWFLDDSGDIIEEDDSDWSCDCYRYQIGNYFKTKEEALKYSDKILIYNRLKDLALKYNKGEKLDWSNGNQKKFYIYFDNQAKRLEYAYHSTYKDIGAIYCIDPEFLETAMDEIGEEDLMKLFEE